MKTPETPRESHLIQTLAGIVPAFMFLLLLTGCKLLPFGGGKVMAWNLEFTKSAQVPNMPIYLVGINQTHKQNYGESVESYFKDNFHLLADVVHLTIEIDHEGKFKYYESNVPGAELGITGTNTERLIVSRTNAVWKQWFSERNAEGLVIIGNFQGTNQPTPDLRKQIIPLYKDVWRAKDHTLQFRILANSIEVVTPPSSGAAKILKKQMWDP